MHTWSFGALSAPRGQRNGRRSPAALPRDIERKESHIIARELDDCAWAPPTRKTYKHGHSLKCLLAVDERTQALMLLAAGGAAVQMRA
jgi:hypothetical protein